MALLMVPLVNGILGVIYISAGLILRFWPVIVGRLWKPRPG